VTPEPLYRKVKRHILERIAARALVEGAQIPSENELTRELGVSRMTAHRALRELTADGVLRRVQGAGTFVAAAKPESALFAVRNIAEEIAARGGRHSAEVLHLGATRATTEEAMALEIKPGARLFHSLLLHRENGLPVQIEDRYVSPAFAPNYLKQDFTRATPNQYLMALRAPDAVEHAVEAILPDRRQQKLLDIAADEPCLLLTRRTWCQGLVVSRARLLHPGRRYRLAGRQEFR
jgi:GntR family transcriptional regulator, histidine utilization repressor